MGLDTQWQTPVLMGFHTQPTSQHPPSMLAWPAGTFAFELFADNSGVSWAVFHQLLQICL
jgi:hypothetical protein